MEALVEIGHLKPRILVEVIENGEVFDDLGLLIANGKWIQKVDLDKKQGGGRCVLRKHITPSYSKSHEMKNIIPNPNHLSHNKCQNLESKMDKGMEIERSFDKKDSSPTKLIRLQEQLVDPPLSN